MWALLFESFAEAFGVTRRVRPLVFALVVGSSLALTALSFAEGGPRGLIALVVLLVFSIMASWQVIRARSELWSAARRSLDDPKQQPEAHPSDADLGPTARSLRLLAIAVSQARRGQFLEAAHTLEKIDRDRLRADEERLFEGARALVSLGLGDTQRAAQQAARALPTMSEDIDAHLGRTVVADAWSDSERLRALDEAWEAQGVDRAVNRSMGRLRAIVRLRIDTSALEALEDWEAKALADEARAVGDEALAADLEGRMRRTAYR